VNILDLYQVSEPVLTFETGYHNYMIGPVGVLWQLYVHITFFVHASHIIILC